MTLTLHDYQNQAVDSVRKAFQRGHRRVVLQLGPGSGKSVICAEICRLAAEKNKGRKVLVLCHSKEIISQNVAAVERLIPGCKTSVYCNGLNSKDFSGQFVFASRDSLPKALNLPEFPLVIVDEAHLVSIKSDSSYQVIFQKVKAQFVVGMTATPYRMLGGNIYGKGKPFEVRSYCLGIKELIQKGFLTPYRFVERSPSIVRLPEKAKTENYELLGALAMQAVESRNSVDWIMSEMSKRKCVIIYCCSRAHAKKIQSMIPGCAYIDGDTKGAERDDLIERMRAGKQQFTVNCNVLTTGTDIPICDGIVFLRPTLSAALYVQALGRALRIHPDKKEALILELTDNLARFEDINDPLQFGTNTENELDISLGNEAPTKECPECKDVVAVSTKVCPSCDYLFIKKRELYTEDLIMELPVISYSYELKPTRAGPLAYLVKWNTPRGVIPEWLNFRNDNDYIRKKALAVLRKMRESKILAIKVSKIWEEYPKVHAHLT